MENKQAKGSGRIPIRFLRAGVFCIVCMVVNCLGSQIALQLKLPVYLDSLGTVLASMIGGYVPGIVVGYLAALLQGIFSASSIYYGIIDVIIAIIVAYFARRKWFRKLSFTMLAALVLAFVCGTLTIVVSTFVTGVGVERDVSVSLARSLQAIGTFDPAMARVMAVYFVEFIDKMLVVLFATLVHNMLSEELLASFDFVPWQQRPLSTRELDDAMNEKPRMMSLGTKVVILVATIVLFVVVATTAFSQITYHRSMVDAESTKARGITALMASVVDPNKISEFEEKGEAAPGYLETEARLASIRDSFDDVQYVYVYDIEPDGCHVILDPDTAEEPGSDPGDVIPFDESFKDFLPALLAGEEIDPVISDETYGWLLTVYQPLKNQMGETVCYLAADISMAHLIAEESSFFAGIVTLFAAFFVLVWAVVLWLSRYGVIVPINSISRVSNGFMISGEGIRPESLEPIEALDIHTGDEIENLYDAVKQMSEEAVRYIDESQEQSNTIARMQSNLIMVMADLVESRDKFTGDHVRNTASYARIIMNQMRREGICSDVLTNEFISNVYQSAPLHDIGKIAVSDVILNKPGRLTEEEFAIMKSHTIAGQQILESAKSAVSESSYLDEAQRLAAYHHEKWDGSGYPYGLAGEDIPLSARIMAVADVFDALVSKRSYKAGFPVEKAFAIIEEGIGTHFDPQVARAFLHARDKAAAVAQKSEEKKRLEEEAAKREEAQNGEQAQNTNESADDAPKQDGETNE